MFIELSKALKKFREAFGDSVVLTARATDKSVVVEVIVFVKHGEETFQFSVLAEVSHGEAVESASDWADRVSLELDTEIESRLEKEK